MDGLSGLLVPIGLGLLGFIEPCSIGSTLLFLRAVAGRPAATIVMQAVVFTLTRVIVVGLLGAAAALVGTAFLGFQRATWVLLGVLYVVLGLTYLTGNAGSLMRALGLRLRSVSAGREAAGLAVLFGLNIPACAAPLLAAVLGTATLGGSGRILQGFATLALFGRVPIVIGVLLAALGTWSIYLGLLAR